MNDAKQALRCVSNGAKGIKGVRGTDSHVGNLRRVRGAGWDLQRLHGFADSVMMRGLFPDGSYASMGTKLREASVTETALRMLR